MPKIRGFKPDLWTDEDFVELSAFARLLWMGMWNYACDNGHLDDKPKQIKMRVLPTDRCNVAELLRELEGNGRIQRENGTITIPNFTKHQRPDKRYFQTCDNPGCARPSADSQPETRGGHNEAPSGPQVGSRGPRVDGELKGSDGDSELKVRAGRATQLPSDWTPNDQHRSFAGENRINLPVEADQFRDHHRAKGSTMKDWDASFRTWLRNAVKFRGGSPLTVVPKQTDDQGRTVLPPLPSSFWGDR